ncbi:hypothetical protein CEXT_558401 [Caerostris extrusa]|uniref:Uncharacterized protein n=1 Tax=Caerostris extrusa TaxID=172846 RepID=A0AAV4Q5F1_CAEEX|nr:hypothetical protein CEXT_558401 [Caerostris extrusa]
MSFGNTFRRQGTAELNNHAILVHRSSFGNVKPSPPKCHFDGQDHSGFKGGYFFPESMENVLGQIFFLPESVFISL